jgi:guanosine-3',5'-bis(diphosphate) 3'-pyrophosphohydrolase
MKARKFAIDNHRRVNQLYDGLPYHIHLMEVVEFVNRFDHLLDDSDIDVAVCAAWLHDVVEDTGITYNDVKEVVGNRIADLVVNLTTNIHGKTRDERADDNYYERVKSDNLSIFVKIADRLANMFHSLNYGNESMYKKYKKELPHFKEKLYNGMYDEMWELLENIEKSSIKENFYFPDIEKFDEISIYKIHLPKPISFGMYNELYKKGIVPKKDLIKNKYYKGKCRNATVALWNGFEFVYMRSKYGHYYIDEVNHLEDDNGYDLFVPLRIEENPSETQIIKY